MTSAPLGKVLARVKDEVRLEEDVSYETAGILSYGKGLFRRPAVLGKETTYKSYFRIEANHFVYSRLFAWEGGLAVVPKEFDGLYVSPEFPVFNIDTSLADPRYISLLCQWPYLWEQLRAGESGIGGRRKRVHPEHLLGIRVPLPTLLQQERIVDLVQGLDLASHCYNRYGSAARDVTATLVDQLFEKDPLSSKPTELVSLDGMVEEVRARAKDPSSSGLDVFVGLEHLDGGSLRVRRWGHPSEVTSTKTLFEPGDVLFGKLRPYLRKVALAETAGICSTDILALRPVGDVMPEYVAIVLSSKRAIEHAVATSAGTRMPRTSFAALKTLKVPRPSPADQEKIVQAVDSVEQIAAAAERALDRSTALRSGVLTQLLTGSLTLTRRYDRAMATAQ